MKLSILHILFINLFITIQVYAQSIYYQDVYHGGFCATGTATGLSSSGDIDVPLYIEPGSTLRKVFLVACEITQENVASADYDIFIEGIPINLNQESSIGNTVNNIDNVYSGYRTHVVDITNEVSLVGGSLNIFMGPQSLQSSCPACHYSAPMLLVLYENPILDKVNVSIKIINGTHDNNNSVAIDDFNPSVLSSDIALGVHSDRIAGNLNDGFDYYLNSNYIGQNNLSDSPTIGGGTVGRYYYQNGILVGLTDDVSNTSLSGSDGIAVINSYINGNIDPINIDFNYIQAPTIIHNILVGFYFAYESPCDTFSVSVPNDTTLCYGETLQLNVNVPSPGPQTAYEWTTSTGSAPVGLSCSDCPDPIFTADSSMLYTVRVWNNDSCSVVRPLKITVNRTQIDSLDISPPDCGASNGSIVIYAHNTLNETLSYASTGSATVTGSTVSGLSEGSYTISVQDAMGCPVVDSTIFLSAVNNTVAQFALDPTVGNVPLEIDVYNQSQNATEYEWYINGTYVGDNLGGYTIENGGEHVFELVAWRYDPSCADTFSVIVWASEVIIPTAFTPNNDGDNDVWELVNLDAHFPKNKVKVFNRWGNLLYESQEGNYANNPWNGTYNGEPVPVGSYYFIIETHTKGVDDFKGIVTVIRE